MKISNPELQQYKRNIAEVEDNIEKVGEVLEKYKDFFDKVEILYTESYNDNTYDAYFGGVIFYIKDSDLVLDLTHESHDLYLDFLEFKEIPLENTNDPNYRHWANSRKTQPEYLDLNINVDTLNTDLAVIQSILENHPKDIFLNEVVIDLR